MALNNDDKNARDQNLLDSPQEAGAKYEAAPFLLLLGMKLHFYSTNFCRSISAAAPRVVLQHATQRMKHGRRSERAIRGSKREGRGEHSDYLRATDERRERERRIKIILRTWNWRVTSFSLLVDSSESH